MVEMIRLVVAGLRNRGCLLAMFPHNFYLSAMSVSSPRPYQYVIKISRRADTRNDLCDARVADRGS